MGITNTLASVPGILGPYVVGSITNNNVRIFEIIFEFVFVFMLD